MSSLTAGRFHSEQRRQPRPVCKECFRAGKGPVDLAGPPEEIPCVHWPMRRGDWKRLGTDQLGGRIVARGGDGGARKGVSVADFELLSVIGQGAFGKVLLVRHAATDKLHAMKVGD